MSYLRYTTVYTDQVFNKQIICSLNEFTIRIGQLDDLVINNTIEIMKSLNKSEIDSHIYSILTILESMTSVNCDFALFTHTTTLCSFARTRLANILKEIKYDF